MYEEIESLKEQYKDKQKMLEYSRQERVELENLYSELNKKITSRR